MLRIGTSGFSYDDWVGKFYPPGLSKSKWFDYYATHFDCLEVNVSYYTWLSHRMVESLVSRAPSDFRFSVKLNKALTHTRKNVEEGIVATLDQNRLFGDTLSTHLAQFPNGFAYSEQNWDYILRLAESIQPLTVEFRNSSWQTPEVIEGLHTEGVSYCCVDQPQIEGLLHFEPVVTAPPAYVRFHGRNAAQWYEHEKAWQRYDYLYSEEELTEFVGTISEMSDKAQETMVFFNNHYGAQAVTNARQLGEMMGMQAKQGQASLEL